MTAQIDDAFLHDLGLSDIPTEQKEALIGQLIETLQLRIGERLSEDLTDEQIADFEHVTSEADAPDDVAMQWLVANNPQYPAIVEAEVEKLKQDMITNVNIVVDKGNTSVA